MGSEVKEGQKCLQLRGREQPSAKAVEVHGIGLFGFLCGFLTLSKPGVPSLWMQIHTSHQHFTVHAIVLASCHISFLVFSFFLPEQVS